MALDDWHVSRSTNAAFLRRLLAQEREAHELLVLATDASLLGWVTWDLQTGEAEWDDRGRLILGLEDDAQAKSAEAWMERIPPEDRQRVERHVQECISEGKNLHLEYRIVLPDGSVRDILGTGMFRVGPDGAPRRGTGLVRDVTEFKRAQEERDRLRSLEDASQAKAAERKRIGRELHDRVSHLMGVVHQSLELHEVFKESDPQKAAEKMKLARSATKEAMRWTRDLSEMLRVPEDESTMRTRLTRLLYRDVPEQIAHHLSVEGDERTVSPVVREQLFLVLREAVRNVVTHSGAGEVRVSVSVGPEAVTGGVEDDGRGFGWEDETAHNAQGGGLAYMAERAKLIGGTCSVESEPGKGTRVTVRFPLP